MIIELLYFDGCPHVEATLDLVRSVAAALGVPGDVQTLAVSTQEDAERLGFPGSPTLRIDGVDVDPSAAGGTQPALGCRIYGSSGVPPRSLVERAMDEARAKE